MSFSRYLLTTLAAGSLFIGTAGFAAEPNEPAVHNFPGGVPVKREQPATEATETKADEPTVSEWQQQEASENAMAAQNQQAASEHYFLGTHYFGKWELNLAESEFDQAVRYQPDLRIAHRDLCLVSLAKFNIPRAIAEFCMVTGLGDPVPYNDAEKQKMDQNSKTAHYKKALDWANRQNFPEAISELQWAAKYGPEDPTVHHSLAYAYSAAGDFANAEAEYARTFAANPKDGSAHADYADLLANKGQVDQAQAEMAKAVKLTPGAAAYHVDLGWIAESRNDLPTAITEFEQAVKLSPNHDGLWEHFGRLLEKSGKTAEAQQAFQRALKLNPQSAEAREDLKRLEQVQPKQPDYVGQKQEA